MNGGPPEATVQRAVTLFAALAHPARLRVLAALARSAPRSAGDLQPVAGLEQSALSHQLRVLREAGLVSSERRGRRVLYALADEHVAHIVRDALLHAEELG